MNVFAYCIYAITVFTVYTAYMIGIQEFCEYILPGLIAIVLIFAPLVWNTQRQLNEFKKETK